MRGFLALAAFGAPWLAGVVFDLSGGYTPALILAGAAALASAALAAGLPEADLPEADQK